MGSKVGKSRKCDYYGTSSIGEGFSYEETLNQDGFVLIKASHDSGPEISSTTVEEGGPAGRNKSPIEPCFDQVASEELTSIPGRTEVIVDSGYAENLADAAAHCSGEAGQKSVPVPSKENGYPYNLDQTEQTLLEQDCRTTRSLGNHHAFFGYRFFDYDDVNCEGNRHILDNDL